MPTLVARTVLERSERLVRRLVGEDVEAFWATASLSEEITAIAPNSRVNLTDPARVIVTCAPGQSLVLGWTQGGNTVELPVDQMVFVSSPVAAAYVRNAATSGDPTPVRIVTF